MCAPQLAQIDMALQGRIHQADTVALSNGRLDDCQRQRGNPQPLSLYNVRARQVAPTLTYTIAAGMVTCPWHGDFNDLRCKSGEAMPPRGSHPAPHR
jgi:hypothetical protein